MAPNRRHEIAKPKSSTEVHRANLEWFLFFVVGAVIGMLAGRLAKRAEGTKEMTAAKYAVRYASKESSQQYSALPQSQTISEIRGHEKSEVSLAMLGAVAVVLLLGAFVVHSSLWWWMNTNKIHSNAIAQPASEAKHSFPHLQLTPERDLREYIVKQSQELHGTNLLGPTSGAVHIPIERAMSLVANEGLSKWRTTNRSGTTVSPAEFQQQRAKEATNAK